ncbi:flagellar motor switch protein FliM [Bradyrhizobium sp. LB7.2]
MAGTDQPDQDAIAAQWEASLDSEDPAEAAKAAAENELSETMALQWAAMVEDGSRDLGAGKNSGERVLSQEEIDNLLGFTAGDVTLDDHSGIRAIIDSAMVSYERLPMLEIVFDRLVRLLTTSLRNFTSDNVEVSLDRITSVRFGDYMNSIPLPAVLTVFKAEEWDNFGMAVVDSSLIYSMIDVLLGGRRGSSQLRIEGRPYTTIETELVKRLVEVVMADAEQAFRPLSPVTFTIDRLETNPRFAAISRPANAAILVRLRIDMEDRGGNIELLLPYATIEPIRGVLLQMFMGEKFGRDQVWEGHFATEIVQAEISVDAVLYESRHSAQAADAAEGRRHAAAGHARGCQCHCSLRRRHDHRRTHGPGRRSRRDSGDETPAQAKYDTCDVRKGRRAEQDDGGPMNHSLGMAIETLVAILLMLTIFYCVMLNKRLTRLKADEHSLKAVIGELITATEIAERAIGGLKLAVRDVNENLGSQLVAATQMSEQLYKQLGEADNVVRRLSKIAIAARPMTNPDMVAAPAAKPSSAKAVAAAAEAFSERRRSNGLAA